ncbi:mitochondrial carrier domain-containing protein [Entophlyctis helioformis]|nr:mitochondrial carrier domain-containing protein [Entophlyctis helioformis]
MAASTAQPKPSTIHALMAGATAGFAVDTILFPLDTIKTRLQSKAGFRASGGFKNIYAGLSSAALGSAPSAAAFFVTYELCKSTLAPLVSPSTTSADASSRLPLVHMASASMAEIMACTVRVPTEVVKQRMQAGIYKSVPQAFSDILKREGPSGFFRGYTMTVFREIPFSCVQFPLYEGMKTRMARWLERPLWSGEASLCGCIAGGIAAAVTTPLDVVKTRIMLSQKSGKAATIWGTFTTIIAEEGPRKLLAGIGPRVTWISIGGSIFLGVYEAVKSALGSTGL